MRRFRQGLRPSKESKATRYYTRAVKRLVRLIFWIFVLFCVIMALIWVVPKIWNWALR